MIVATENATVQPVAKAYTVPEVVNKASLLLLPVALFHFLLLLGLFGFFCFLLVVLFFFRLFYCRFFLFWLFVSRLFVFSRCQNG